MRSFFDLHFGTFFCLMAIAYLVFLPVSVFASFGITPPYVRNTSLTRNATYEQQILLVRGNPTEDLNAQVVIDAPEIAGWVQILEGDTILLPRGVQKIPMTVKVTVPGDAAFKDYEGKIRIRTMPTDDQVSEGVVSISLGAQVDINLTVIDRVIEDFRIRRISVSDLNEGHKFGWLFFPGKIDFTMLTENIGNVDVAPSDVVFKIYDRTGAVMLEETSHTGRLKKINPFATDEIVASLPTRLPAGSYLARYSIYNGEEIKQEGEVTLSILPYGTLQTAGYGFLGLSIAHKVSVLLPVLSVVIVILYLVYARMSRRQNRA